MCPNSDVPNEQVEAKQKILIADDEASIRRILETRLSMIGYDIVTAADGEEAVAVFNKENTIENLKKHVIQQNTNGKSENSDITVSICKTGFIFPNTESNFYPLILAARFLIAES